MKAIRGAITVSENSPESIFEATQALLKELQRRNAFEVNDIISMFFTLTPDLTAAFPARAAREIGWDVPMLDTQEIDVPGALRQCLRVLIHVKRSGPTRHVYLRGATSLRPDLQD